ncbi:3-dehydroquinate synthase family protein [Nocardiopsis kunsanensis]|uniref:3-dehydroquinate synthase family protein n=1 Tax=Nocardiopsis kunsanensis TaxID=141693 RepID=UPI001E336F94|nr:2-epi-5-epi-valiolone synthase [Nocardiopsis kunsanensis]
MPGVQEDTGGLDLLAPDGTEYRVDLVDDVLSPRNPLLAERLEGRRTVAFVSPNVDRLYGDRLRTYLGTYMDASDWSLTVLPTGEHNKTLASAEWVCEVAKRSGLDRNGVLLGMGGGVLADVVGFSASVYARGVRHARINTTLVGQVDVGVGVKTGVNSLGSKNMLGTYHPPHASLCDQGLLASLPERELRCGLAEIAKLAMVLDLELFTTLERCPDVFLRDGAPGQLETHVMRTAMRLMMEQLCPNLREHDLARLVDFGHTFSPVIETAGGHRLKHGEAVAVDMALSCLIARHLGLLRADECERALDLIRRSGLPLYDPGTCTPELMADAVRAARQRRGGRLNLVVPSALGAGAFVESPEDVPERLLTAALAELETAEAANGPRELAR